MGFLNNVRSLLVGSPPVKSAIPEKFVLRKPEPLRIVPPGVLGSLWSKEEAWLERALNPFTSNTRAYDVSTTHSYTADWQGFSTSGNYEVLNAWRQVCYLSRDLERNNSHAISFLRELKNNVLGSTGIRMQPRVMLQKGGRLNKPLNLEIKNAWTDFRRKGNFEVTGQWSGQTLDEVLLQRLATDGGAVLRLHRGYSGNKYRFAVQAMEVDALDLWYNTTYQGSNNRVTMGIETNSFAKPVAYWLLDYYQSDLMANNATGTRVRVPASDIVHLWMPGRITAVRGVSWFAPAMIDLRMLGKYEEAAVISARNAAAKMGFFEREKDLAARYEGQAELKDGTIIEEVNPGLIVDLPTGVKFKPFDPGQPNDTYPDFRKNILRTICSGLGAMYNSVGNDLESINYSSARFGKDVENETWKSLQRFYAEQLLQEVFNAWLECSVLSGAIEMPFSQIENVQKSIVWRPRGYAYVDPTKETQSALAAIDGGLSTYRKELADLGIDFDEFLDEVEYERDELERRGIVFVNAYSRRPEVEASLEDPAVKPGTLEAEAKPAANGKNGKSAKATARS
jgi:lambda family phage portal protein